MYDHAREHHRQVEAELHRDLGGGRLGDEERRGEDGGEEEVAHAR